MIIKDNVVLNSGISISIQSDTRPVVADTCPDFIMMDICMAVRAICYAGAIDIMDEIIFNGRAGFHPENPLQADSPGVAGACIIADDVVLDDWRTAADTDQEYVIRAAVFDSEPIKNNIRSCCSGNSNHAV